MGMWILSSAAASCEIPDKALHLSLSGVNSIVGTTLPATAGLWTELNEMTHQDNEVPCLIYSRYSTNANHH